MGWAPGRFGFDTAEYALHEAEAHLALGRAEQAAARAEVSAARTVEGTPGWAAGTLVLAQAEADVRPADAAQRALEVLDRIPPARCAPPLARAWPGWTPPGLLLRLLEARISMSGSGLCRR